MSTGSLMSTYKNIGGSKKSQEDIYREDFELRKDFFKAMLDMLKFQQIETANPDIVEAIGLNGQNLFYCSKNALAEVSPIATNMCKPIIISDFTGGDFTHDDAELLPRNAKTFILGEPTNNLCNVSGNICFLKNTEGGMLIELLEGLQTIPEL